MNDRVGSVVAEYHLPCAEALLAGTLALMTGYAQSACPRGQENMAAKIVANLDALVRHAALSPQFRMVLGNVRTHWQGLSNASLRGTAGAHALH